MAAIDFPSSPTVGQSVTVGGVTWTWDGVKWTTSGSAGAALPLAMNDNRIINGDMHWDQRNNGATVTATGSYAVDRWTNVVSVASKLSFQRGPAGPSLASYGYGYYLQGVTTTAYTPAAGESFSIRQPIEADMVSDFAWGTPNAQPVTLSFLFDSSSLTGTFGGSIKSYDGTRSYPFTFNCPVANVWQKVVVAIPGDTAGTWVMSGNGGSMYLCFDLGSGATFRAPAGAWASGNFIGANGAVNSVGTLNNQYQVTGVKLEVGSVATPFNRQSLAKSMADCQRYYQKLGGTSTGDIYIGGYATASAFVGSTIGFPTMRAAPTATQVGSWSLSNTAGPSYYLSPSTIGINIQATAAAATSYYNSGGYITLYAEL